MKSTFLIVALLVLFLNIEAQTLQSKIIPFNGNPNVAGIEVWEDQFIISAISFIEDTVGSTFIFMDSELSSIEEFEFRGFAANNGGVIVNEKEFFVFGNNNYQEEYVTLLKTGEKFNQPQKFNYLTNSEFNFSNTALLVDKYFFSLTVDTYINPERKETFLQKIDLEGNEVWNLTLGKNETYTAGIDISTIENGDLLIGSIRIIQGELFTELVKMDQLGNEQWTVIGTENTPPGYSLHWTTELTDENLLNISTVDRSQDEEFIINNWSKRPPKIIWLDAEGNSYKDTLLISDREEPYTHSGVKAGNGDYFFIYGSKGNLDFLSGDYGWLCKMSNEGEMIWNRKYHHTELTNSGFFHNIRDIIELDNGDLITLGRLIKPGGNYQIWAMRLNAEGCFSDDVCGDISTAINEIELTTNKINLYPNPTSGIVKISFHNEMDKDLEFISVIDIHGTTAYVEYYNNQEYLDLSHLPKGMYYVQFKLADGFVYSEKLILK